MASNDNKCHYPTAKKEGLQPAKKATTGRRAKYGPPKAYKLPVEKINSTPLAALTKKMHVATQSVSKEISKNHEFWEDERDQAEDDIYEEDVEIEYWCDEFYLPDEVLKKMGEKMLKDEGFCKVVVEGGEYEGCPVKKALEGESFFNVNSKRDQCTGKLVDGKLKKKELKEHCQSCGADAFLHRLVLAFMNQQDDE